MPPRTGGVGGGRRPAESGYDLDAVDLESDSSATDLDRVAQRDVVLRALQRLSRRQRAVVVLRFLEDLSVERTAEVLGCSVGTVKTQSSRGLQRPRAELAHLSPDRPALHYRGPIPTVGSGRRRRLAIAVTAAATMATVAVLAVLPVLVGGPREGEREGDETWSALAGARVLATDRDALDGVVADPADLRHLPGPAATPCRRRTPSP